MMTSWLMRWFRWRAKRAYPWSSPKIRTTSIPRTAPITTVSSDSWRSDQTPTTPFSPEMVSTSATPDGLQTIMVNIGLREEWKDWQISSVVTHSRSLSLTLTRTRSPR
jgi:hypothetical protein